MTVTTELPRWLRDLLVSSPARGAGLNLWLYKVARALHTHRTDDEITQLLAALTAGEAVRPGEIERAVKRSAATAWKPGQPVREDHEPAWPLINADKRAAIIATGLGLVDLWETSPVRFEDRESHAEEVIDALFPGDPLLCVGRSNSQFETKPRESWRGRLAQMQLIVPSPMSARTGLTQEGKVSEHSLANTGPRGFLVIEQDSGTVDEQSAVLLHLAEHAPLALALHSGSKSIHGWFDCARQLEERLREFMRAAVSLGADKALWTRSQFVRMPGGTRDNGNHQTVYFFNPEVCK